MTGGRALSVVAAAAWLLGGACDDGGGAGADAADVATDTGTDTAVDGVPDTVADAGPEEDAAPYVPEWCEGAVVPSSFEASLQHYRFVEAWLKDGVGRVIDPYASFDTPPLAP